MDCEATAYEEGGCDHYDKDDQLWRDLRVAALYEGRHGDDMCVRFRVLWCREGSLTELELVLVHVCYDLKGRGCCARRRRSIDGLKEVGFDGMETRLGVRLVGS